MPDHNYFANLIWQIADLLRCRNVDARILERHASRRHGLECGWDRQAIKLIRF